MNSDYDVIVLINYEAHDDLEWETWDHVSSQLSFKAIKELMEPSLIHRNVDASMSTVDIMFCLGFSSIGVDIRMDPVVVLKMPGKVEQAVPFERVARHMPKDIFKKEIEPLIESMTMPGVDGLDD